MKKVIAICFLLLFTNLFSLEVSNGKIRALYNSLDPHSIGEHLAFYELYSQFPEGKKALHHACYLLTGTLDSSIDPLQYFSTSPIGIEAIVALVNKPPTAATLEINDHELEAIEKLAHRLPNRLLKGHKVTKEDEVLSLPPEQIDLSRGILLTQLGHSPEAIKKIRSYEAMIDLMALQILARIPLNAPPVEKIYAINHFIFDEMGFRFPPQSLYAKDIDVYTFLPSVLDSKRGVCLGVSILYLCLAQRLNLNLEMITPPGHIFVRYRNGEKIINIETTARGIHLDSDEYLGIDTCSLQQRNIKDVIGLAHFNQASVFWEQKQYQKALACYEKALKYLPQDQLLKELMAYNYLLSGEVEKGETLLKQVVNFQPEHKVVKETIAEDYLNGNVSIEGIGALFTQIDEKRDSLDQKRQELEKILEKNPKFRSGLFSLAGIWIQLHREAEAIDVLNRYHDLDPSNPTVEYYLTVMYSERYDYNNAWKHLRLAQNIVSSRNYHPKSLNELRRELSIKCPE